MNQQTLDTLNPFKGFNITNIFLIIAVVLLFFIIFKTFNIVVIAILMAICFIIYILGMTWTTNTTTTPNTIPNPTIVPTPSELAVYPDVYNFLSTIRPTENENIYFTDLINNVTNFFNNYNKIKITTSANANCNNVNVAVTFVDNARNSLTKIASVSSESLNTFTNIMNRYLDELKDICQTNILDPIIASNRLSGPIASNSLFTSFDTPYVFL